MAKALELGIASNIIAILEFSSTIVGYATVASGANEERQKSVRKLSILQKK